MKKIILCLIFTFFLTGCTDSNTTAIRGNTEERNAASDTVYEMPGAIEQSEVTYAVCESAEERPSTPEIREQMYAPYAKFGMVYDKEHNTLKYKGEFVRWFEDYYSVGDGTYAGADFFDRNGTTDVYAERDFSKTTVSSDGSYDPGGELTGLKKFSQEEFDRRDVSALLQPRQTEATTEAIAGDEFESEADNMRIAAEYAPFGIAYYDTPNGGWYYKNKKIRSFRDILTSNGENINSGKFHGTIRCFGSSSGTVTLAAVRDYDRPDAEGNGTLTGIEILEDDYAPDEVILSESPSSTP